MSVTDNGSAGWTLIQSEGANGLAVYWWYKVANATDVSSLTTVTFSWTNGSGVLGGCVSMDEYDGFIGTPTLDLNPTGVEANAATITITGGVAINATELALSLLFSATTPSITGTNTYSPNAGTNTYTWTNTTSTVGGSGSSVRGWATPTATPATSSKFVRTWTASHPTQAEGATFYDPGTGPTNTGGFFSLMAGMVSMGIVAAATKVMLAAGNVTQLTQAQFNTLASWGVGAVNMGSSSGGGASWPFGFGGSAAFNGSGGGATQTALTAAAVLAHNAGIKVYLGIYLQNYNWGTQVTTNPAPMLGGWDPAFTDANGNGYGSQTTAGSWYKMCFDYGAAIAVMNLDGMYWDTEGGGIGPSNNDFVTWQWRNFNNNYGQTSSQATENANAQTVGANMMAAINAGFQSKGGNSAISGNQVPIITYQSNASSIGTTQPLNGYLDAWGAFTGNTIGVFIHGSGTVQVSYHSAIGTSTWSSFLAGVASATTGPIMLGDSTFYGYQVVTSGGPYSSDSDGGWARALSANTSALAALSLGPNVTIAPFVWIYDSDSANGGAGIWPQAVWNQAIGPIIAASAGTTYSIFQFSPLRSGSSLIVDYTDNTYNGSPNINYTPLT